MIVPTLRPTLSTAVLAIIALALLSGSISPGVIADRGLLQAVLQSHRDAPPFMPLKKGTKWTYEITEHPGIMAEPGETDCKFQKTVEIVACCEKPRVTEILMHQSYSTRKTATIGGDALREYSLYAIYGGTRLYDISWSDGQANLKEFREFENSAASEKLKKEPGEASLLLDATAEVGSVWDNEPNTPIGDGMYEWMIDRKKAIGSDSRIGGRSLGHPATLYKMVFNTLSNETVRTFVTGVGFIHRDYKDTCVNSESNERLVKFQPG